jgi:death-on-curing protein
VFIYFARDHCFSDGNKRLAWACLVYTLQGWGLDLDATDDEGADLARKVVLKEMEAHHVVRWIVARIKADGHA